MPSIEKATVEDLATAVAKATIEAHREARAEERPLESRKVSRTSAFNPTGGPRPTLSRPTVFCGADQMADSLTNEEIELFNKVQAGRYNKGRWQVVVRDDGMDETSVDIRIPASTAEQRMEMPGTLVDVLTKIINEATARAKTPVAAA